MSFTDFKRSAHIKQRAASNGAAITLVADSESFHASFECATRIAQVLGTRDLKDLGDGLLDEIPSYKIPLEDLESALQRLSQRFTIALVDYISSKYEGKYVLLWKIIPAAAPGVTVKQIPSLDEF